jgi:hypothetical protein
MDTVGIPALVSALSVDRGRVESSEMNLRAAADLTSSRVEPVASAV